MTLPPERIGDKGQRFQVKFSSAAEAADESTLGYADTREGAEQLADAWRKHPEQFFVWVVDRHAPAINECNAPPPPEQQG